jgi:GDP-L-fucose synthase
LAENIKEVVNFNGKLTFDTSRPDGAPKKIIDVSRLSNMGWKFNTNLKDGLSHTYRWFKDNYV